MLKNLAGIASIELPPGFEKASEDCDFGHFVEFRHNDSRICYWQKDNYFAPEETALAVEQSLKKRPHSIFKRDPRDPMEVQADDMEYFPVAEALLQPGRILPPYGFDIRSLRTQQINGKKVFRADFEGERFFSSIVIWDANHESGTLRHLWVEGAPESEDILQKEFQKACLSIEWV